VGHHSLGKIVVASSCTGSNSSARGTELAAGISPRHTPTWPPIRVIAAVSYLLGFAAQCLWWGWPTDTLLIFGWLGAGALCWNAGQPWRAALRWVRDWGPVCAVLVGYDYSRGLAAHGLAPHVTAMIKVDEFLAGGRLPTLWLQQHLYDPQRVRWWDVLASVVYLSHFVAVPGVAGVLWLCRRQMWSAFVRRWLVLAIAGVATYLIYPAAPPWWASVHGYLGEHIERLSARGWAALGLDSTGPLFNQGQALANPVAAMPSLHAAFSMFVAVFFLPRVRPRWRLLLLAYPLAMMFTVLYCAEHYLVDVLAGWGYVLATFGLVGFVERRRQHDTGVTEQGRHRRHTRLISGNPRRVPLAAHPSLSPLLVAGVGQHMGQVLTGHPTRNSQPGAVGGAAASRRMAAPLHCKAERHGSQVPELGQIGHPSIGCAAAGPAG
jgi:membrane-associated phospholipid phosphatase